MIDIYMKLGEPENAEGLFAIASSLDIHIKIEWYEKIGKYEEAYKSYLDEEKSSYQKLKCLSQISDERFIQEFQSLEKQNPFQVTNELSYLAIEAYSHLEQWDKF